MTVTLLPPRSAQRSGAAAVARARLVAGELELEQFVVVQPSRGRNHEVGVRRRIRGIALALEPVDERLEDEREPVAAAILCRPCEQDPLAFRARGVVGSVPQEELAAVGSRLPCTRGVEL